MNKLQILYIKSLFQKLQVDNFFAQIFGGGYQKSKFSPICGQNLVWTPRKSESSVNFTLEKLGSI